MPTPTAKSDARNFRSIIQLRFRHDTPLLLVSATHFLTDLAWSEASRSARTSFRRPVSRVYRYVNRRGMRGGTDARLGACQATVRPPVLRTAHTSFDLNGKLSPGVQHPVFYRRRRSDSTSPAPACLAFSTMALRAPAACSRNQITAIESKDESRELSAYSHLLISSPTGIDISCRLAHRAQM